MIDREKPKTGAILQSALRWLAVVVLLTAFACALWINFGFRMPVETSDRTVGLLVDYDELKRIADGSQEISFADMARKAVVAGATGLVVRERILADWENAGDIMTFSGAQLAFQSGDTFRFKPVNEKTYILTKDALVHEQLYSLLEAKKRYPEIIMHRDYLGIAVQLSSSERATLGLGYPLKQLEEAARMGLRIIPRIRNWEPVRGDSIEAALGWVAKIPNLAGIGFNDMSVPGGGANPILQDMLAFAIEPLDKPLITFEFYDQAGLAGLADRLGGRVFRAHAIAENELKKYANIPDAVDRYRLAASERNIRYIYIRFYGLENPAASMMSNMDLITAVYDGLVDEGLRIGEPDLIEPFKVGFISGYLAGAGVVMAGVFLFALGFEASLRDRGFWPELIYAGLFILGCAAWAGLLVLYPVMARKLCALAGAVFFPSLGVALFTRKESPAAVRERAAYEQAAREQAALEQAELERSARERSLREEAERARLSHVRVIYKAATREQGADGAGVVGSPGTYSSSGSDGWGVSLDKAWDIGRPDGSRDSGATESVANGSRGVNGSYGVNDTRGGDTFNPGMTENPLSVTPLSTTPPTTPPLSATPPMIPPLSATPPATPRTSEDAPDLAAISAFVSNDSLYPAGAASGRLSSKPRRAAHTALIFLGVSTFTFAGAMIMSSLLADPAFMLKLDSFLGVKAAHIAPLILIPLILILREESPYSLISGAANDRVRFWQLFAGLILLAGLAVYIIRTGNDSPGAISDIEARLRQYLGDILAVRPRTKEFLIGHPMMLILLYYGYRFETLPLLLVGTIGQISLINTYAHIHTPLAVSMLRSLHGAWIGVILGLTAIFALNLIFPDASRAGKSPGADKEA